VNPAGAPGTGPRPRPSRLPLPLPMALALLAALPSCGGAGLHLAASHRVVESGKVVRQWDGYASEAGGAPLRLRRVEGGRLRLEPAEGCRVDRLRGVRQRGRIERRLTSAGIACLGAGVGGTAAMAALVTASAMDQFDIADEEARNAVSGVVASLLGGSLALIVAPVVAYAKAPSGEVDEVVTEAFGEPSPCGPPEPPGELGIRWEDNAVTVHPLLPGGEVVVAPRPGAPRSLDLCLEGRGCVTVDAGGALP
jgi:hypothetical protein